MTDKVVIYKDEAVTKEAMRDIVATKRAEYNRTWRAHPTAEGYPKVNRALDALVEAEAVFSEFDA